MAEAEPDCTCGGYGWVAGFGPDDEVMHELSCPAAHHEEGESSGE